MEVASSELLPFPSYGRRRGVLVVLCSAASRRLQMTPIKTTCLDTTACAPRLQYSSHLTHTCQSQCIPCILIYKITTSLAYPITSLILYQRKAQTPSIPTLKEYHTVYNATTQPHHTHPNPIQKIYKQPPSSYPRANPPPTTYSPSSTSDT